MSGIVTYLLLALLVIVAIILFMGLMNMMRGGSANRSQTLMRWRVIAQAVAVAAMVVALFFFGRS
ncbi:MAG: twin transmembrane helix small protein [Nitratireductor sp.]|nr:twin transmembrane helix small protein [Nitratireductor sp.]MCC0021805.1 twin transmembrane helix small protein [Nitratireductor sp.]